MYNRTPRADQKPLPATDRPRADQVEAASAASAASSSLLSAASASSASSASASASSAVVQRGSSVVQRPIAAGNADKSHINIDSVDPSTMQAFLEGNFVCLGDVEQPVPDRHRVTGLPFEPMQVRRHANPIIAGVLFPRGGTSNVTKHRLHSLQARRVAFRSLCLRPSQPNPTFVISPQTSPPPLRAPCPVPLPVLSSFSSFISRLSCLLSVRRRQMCANGHPELHEAIGGRNHALVRTLLLTRDPNFKEKRWGKSPLAVAANVGDLESCRMLVEMGADATLRSTDGSTALNEAVGNMVKVPSRAAERGFPLIIEFLVKVCRLDVDTPMSNGWRALHYAVECGHKDVAKCLLELGSDPNSLTLKHENPLMIASALDNSEISMLLVSRGGKGINKKSRVMEKRALKLIKLRKREVADRIRLEMTKRRREEDREALEKMEQSADNLSFEELLQQVRSGDSDRGDVVCMLSREMRGQCLGRAWGDWRWAVGG